MASSPESRRRSSLAKLQRALGGRAGWGGFALQLLFVAVLVWLGYEIVANAPRQSAGAADRRRLRLPGEHGGL